MDILKLMEVVAVVEEWRFRKDIVEKVVEVLEMLRSPRFWNVVFGEGDDERELVEVKDEAAEVLEEVEALEVVVLEGGGGGRSRGR